MKPYKKISQKVLFENPWWKYCLDQIELPSGKSGEYHYVLTKGSSMVVPEIEKGVVLLVKQYRYTGNRDSIEFPCGGLKEGVTYHENALHELVEETGYVPESIEDVGGFNPCNGLIDEICRVFVARQLRFVGAQPDETESFEFMRLTIDEVDALIQDGTIWDGMTIAAWAIAKPKLQEPGARSQESE
jgi:ADP-ribose pyrophosphatase